MKHESSIAGYVGLKYAPEITAFHGALEDKLWGEQCRWCEMGVEHRWRQPSWKARPAAWDSEMEYALRQVIACKALITNAVIEQLGKVDPRYRHVEDPLQLPDVPACTRRGELFAAASKLRDTCAKLAQHDISFAGSQLGDQRRNPATAGPGDLQRLLFDLLELRKCLWAYRHASAFRDLGPPLSQLAYQPAYGEAYAA
jgi:hypothetical protein